MAEHTEQIALQPFFASIRAAARQLDQIGEPLQSDVLAEIDRIESGGEENPVYAATKALEPFTIMNVELDAGGFAKATSSRRRVSLVEQGWRSFLVRIENPHRLERPLYLSETGLTKLTGKPRQDSLAPRPKLGDRLDNSALVKRLWLDVKMVEPQLSGFECEYKVVSLLSRARGERSAYLIVTAAGEQAFHLGRQGAELAFDCAPSREVTLSVTDADGRSCVAAVTIKDSAGRVYPSRTMRLAPDMPFQDHVYRGSGETVLLADGAYEVTAIRGPEYLPVVQRVTVAEDRCSIAIQLRRWIDPAVYQYFPGDTHIHAAGCSHYSLPTQGVSPETMIRHVRGEALSAASVLTWGPCFYYQKQFFTGSSISPPATLEHPELQHANGQYWQPCVTDSDGRSVLRYDLEISGFPSSHAGHLVLLGLSSQEFGGREQIEQWPSWNLPILEWAKAQGALTGYAHCANGLAVDSDKLPNYLIPAFNGIGANEAIVDIVHGTLDFLSGCEDLPVAELNTWYHLLNVGYRPLMLGETDYPCIFDDRPGVGRTYVRCDVAPSGSSGVEQWLAGLQNGQSYFGDGRSHIFSMQVSSGASLVDGGVLRLPRPAKVAVTADVAAWLSPTQDKSGATIARSAAYIPPAWHIERARVGQSRLVRIELVVNGVCLTSQSVPADGEAHRVDFEIPVERSSWLALRIMPSSHTQAVLVEIADRPIRASRQSAEWCRGAVDALWTEKSPFISRDERGAALAAFEYARREYEARATECVGE